MKAKKKKIVKKSKVKKPVKQVKKVPEPVMPWDYRKKKDADPSKIVPMSKTGTSPNKDVIPTMSLTEAMVEAAANSRINKSYIYINLTNDGDATLAKKYEKNSSVFCYYNGGQVSMDEETSMPEKSNSNLNNTNMSKVKSRPTKTKGKDSSKSNGEGKSLKNFPGLLYKGKPVPMTKKETEIWTAKLASRM